MNIYFFDRHGFKHDDNGRPRPKTPALDNIFAGIETAGLHKPQFVPLDDDNNALYPTDSAPYLLLVHPQGSGDFEEHALCSKLLEDQANAHVLLVSSSPAGLSQVSHPRCRKSFITV